uniref:Uncharacterized protein n=1 Tax=Odontella aurita TaxID=265563 RepID=A0A7S4K3S1_9STRA|mmetsp:Transcript_60822/g.180192  ORF Transcript_60822/g.180192 Transcript_60822/m.180192 type:complete len:155 (+) Transcript_60822:528-992(+)
MMASQQQRQRQLASGGDGGGDSSSPPAHAPPSNKFEGELHALALGAKWDEMRDLLRSAFSSSSSPALNGRIRRTERNSTLASREDDEDVPPPVIASAVASIDEDESTGAYLEGMECELDQAGAVEGRRRLLGMVLIPPFEIWMPLLGLRGKDLE